MNKLILELSRGQWLISKEYAGAYLFQAIEALCGNNAVINDKTLTIQAVSQEGVKTIIPDSFINEPSSIFQEIAPESTVILPIQGALTKYDNCGQFGAQSYAQVLQQAKVNPNVKSVILDLDTPGGSADGSYDVSQAVAELKEVKPVYAYVNGMAASAGYRIAAHATGIIAKPGSIVGSIGTMVTLTDFTTYLAQRGIREVEVYATDSKDKNRDYREAINGNHDLIRENILDPMNDIFLNEMRTQRGIPDEALTGKVYTDVNEMKQLNLIDATGSLQDVIELSNTNFRRMSKSFKEQVMSLLGLSQETDPVAEATEQFTEPTVEPSEVTAEVVAEEKVDYVADMIKAEVSKAIEATSQKLEELSQANEQLKAENAELKESVTAIAKAVKTTYKAPVASVASEPSNKRLGSKKTISNL